MTSVQNIRDAITAGGVAAGDHLVVHSSLRAAGPVEGGADGLLDALLEVVGREGTLAMPAFNYSRPKPQPYFDPAVTAGRTGTLSEIFRKRTGVLRSQHPTHSVVAYGSSAAEFLADHDKVQTLGVDSPLDRIARGGGWILLLGVTHMSNSTIHVGESHAKRKKFRWEEGPPPVVKMLRPDGSIIDHPLDATSSCSMAFNEIEWPMRRKARIIDLAVGPALSFLMRGKDVIDIVVEALRESPDALLCTRSICRPCSKARAYLQERHDEHAE